MKRLIIGLAVAALAVTAVPVYALTVDDVIGLTRANASDAIIMSKIDADGTVFKLTVDEILQLKDAGVSDAVITYMINTGKNTEVAAPDSEVTEDQSASDQDTEAADESYQSSLDSQYRGNVNVSFGYYYPQWPGYWYTYYYDPFFWPALSYYWGCWAPYPYYRYYYDPWWTCSTRYYAGYWNYYDYHYGYHRYHNANDAYYVDRNGTYRRAPKGRYVGTRGPGSTTVQRVYKSPTRSGDTRVTTRRSVKPNEPRGVTRSVQDGRSVKRPETNVRPSPDHRQVRPAPSRSSSPKREVKPDPRRDRTVSPKPSRVERSSPRRVERPSSPSRRSDSGRSSRGDSGSRSHKP